MKDDPFAVAKRKPEKNSDFYGIFFSGFLFATAKVAYTTAVIILHLILHSTVHIYDFHTYRKLQKVYCHLASQRNREGELLLSRSNISILL